MNKIALITGGSKGLGFELAKQFARDGYDLVLVSRNRNELHEKANILSKQYSNKIEIIPADLSEITAAETVIDTLKSMNIYPNVLVNNAGFGLTGYFHVLDYKKLVDMVNVNIATVVALTRLVLPAMINSKGGGILNVASTAAFFPGPLMSLYYASKTFVLYFSEALREELKESCINVSVLCPGPTRTDFDQTSGMRNTRLIKRRLMPAMTAEKVATIGYNGFKAKRRTIIPGMLNKITAGLSILFPSALTAKAIKLLNCAE